jgi:hypothetical protein
MPSDRDRARYYRDMGRPDVECLARAICVERGVDPDGLVPETGYSDTAMIPLWRKYQDQALEFLAMSKAIRAMPNEESPHE